jgi:hypothetical protein
VGDNVLAASFSCTLGTLTFSNFASNTNSTLGIDIGADPSPNGTPNLANVNENVCTVQQTGGVCPSGDLLAFLSATGNGPTQIATFAVTDPVLIYKNMNDGKALLSEVNQIFVPEPMTLVGAGLLGLGMFGRRRLRK